MGQERREVAEVREFICTSYIMLISPRVYVSVKLEVINSCVLTKTFVM